MFTGIIESMGRLVSTERQGTNLRMSFSCPFLQELKIDQSLAHNGVCLTVVELSHELYVVDAIDETLQKTNLGQLKPGDWVNLERATPLNHRIDGHLVQGHVDGTGTCTERIAQDGSWLFRFSHAVRPDFITVPKGSVCINGVSLTVVDSAADGFSVCIIPYTFQHTTFAYLLPGDRVNLEFDIIGKYVATLLSRGYGLGSAPS